MNHRSTRHWAWAGTLVGVAGVCIGPCAGATRVDPGPQSRSPLEESLLSARRTCMPGPETVERVASLSLTFDDSGVLALRSALDGAAADPEGRVGFRLGRTTVLSDGGIGDADPEAAFPDEATRRERMHSYAHDDAEFDLYDLSLAWPAMSRGAVTLSLIGGLRAISAQAGAWDRGDDGSGGTVTTYEDHSAMVAVPVVGTAVRVDLGGGLHLGGEASTHTLDDGATLLDLSAHTGVRVSPNLGFFAGYQVIRSGVDVGPGEAELDQEGLFARLQIRF